MSGNYVTPAVIYKMLTEEFHEDELINAGRQSAALEMLDLHDLARRLSNAEVAYRSIKDVSVRPVARSILSQVQAEVQNVIDVLREHIDEPVGFIAAQIKADLALGAGAYRMHKNPDGSPGGLVSASARIHETATIAEGARIGPGASVGPGALIEADAIIGRHVRIAPGTQIAAGVEIQKGDWFISVQLPEFCKNPEDAGRPLTAVWAPRNNAQGAGDLLWYSGAEGVGLAGVTGDRILDGLRQTADKSSPGSEQQRANKLAGWFRRAYEQVSMHPDLMAEKRMYAEAVKSAEATYQHDEPEYVDYSSSPAL